MNKQLMILAATAVSLTGCQNEDSPANTSTPSNSATSAETRAQLSAESTELKAELARLQAADPSVKDVYYGVDEAGNRVLHVVRDQGNEQSQSSIWPLVAGMAAGALIGHMISAGGVNNYARQNPPLRTNSYYSREDERRQRNMATSSYNNSLQQNAQRAATPVTPATGAASSTPVRPQASSAVQPSTGTSTTATQPSSVSLQKQPTSNAAPASKDSTSSSMSTRSSSVFSSSNSSSSRSSSYSGGA
ncbi:hypothetical protein LX59_02979 [Azomonas agilis]|uniref:Uncharacterized protein n=1 Tax=Azomonas agilis TaxID=116849 RepID=A0A562HZU9_9GAMM|nr:hypothetical protein [Azomonas agilis]TWH63915.1 hypothetical protein LX59_02979 [Azomonas agilis]